MAAGKDLGGILEDGHGPAALGLVHGEDLRYHGRVLEDLGVGHVLDPLDLLGGERSSAFHCRSFNVLDQVLVDIAVLLTPAPDGLGNGDRPSPRRLAELLAVCQPAGNVSAGERGVFPDPHRAR